MATLTSLLLLLYLLLSPLNSKTLIWFDPMDNIGQSDQWILSNLSNIYSSMDNRNCILSTESTTNYVCTHITSLSYITRNTNILNFTNISIQYHLSGSCLLLYSMDDTMYNVLNNTQFPETVNSMITLSIRFKNNNTNQLCHIDQVYLYGDIANNDIENDKDNNFFVLNTMTIALIALCGTVFCCICFVILCWWRFKALNKENGTSGTPKAPTEDSQFGSAKFRKLFGLEESDKKTTNNPLYSSPYTSSKPKSSKMPEIGPVTPANALRAIHLKTPGRDSIPTLSLQHRPSSNASYSNQTAGNDINETQGNINDMTPEGSNDGSHHITEEINRINNINVKVRKKQFSTIKKEGKKDVVVVERGFQHKTTSKGTGGYDDNTDDDTLSESRTQVLVSEIIGLT